MFKKLVYVFLSLFFISINLCAQKAVGYYYASNTSYPHTAIEYNNLTHIAHAFIYPTTDGEILTDSWYYYPELVSEAKANGVKIITAIGGWGNSDGFPHMAADKVRRANFVNNVVRFCKDNGYDGIDLDWEYPKANDRENFVALVKELREAFDQNGIEIISAALPSSDWNNGYDIASLKDHMDWFGIMTYDFSGPWESVAGYNSPLYKHPRQWGGVHESIEYYKNKGVPKDKLLMGMAFYGYSFNASDPFKPHTGASSITYIKANNLKNSGYKYVFDETSKTPYLQDQNKLKFISYDDTTSIKLKCEYVHKAGIGGTIIWKIGHDYHAGESPLLSTVGQHLFNKPITEPLEPLLVIPTYDEVFDTTSVYLEWQSDEWATSYDIKIAVDESFQNIVNYKSGISLPKYTAHSLANGTKYYWKVCAKNLVGSSEWSAVSSFSINPATSMSVDESLNPVKVKLAQNYPNPFNPLTNIKYRLSASGYITLKVFDLLGREIKTLVNNYQKRGVYEINFNAKDLVSGTYIYQIRVNDMVESKKMTLLK